MITTATKWLDWYKIDSETRRLNLLKAGVAALVLLVGWLHAHSASAQLAAVLKAEKHRILLLTDIGGDRDDEQSFNRFLMYADQYDIEGLIATSIRIFPNENHRPIDGDPQPHYLVAFINAYAAVRANLMQHSKGWPEPRQLLGVIRKGVKTGRDAPFDIHTGMAGNGSVHFPLDQLIGEEGLRSLDPDYQRCR